VDKNTGMLGTRTFSKSYVRLRNPTVTGHPELIFMETLMFFGPL